MLKNFRFIRLPNRQMPPLISKDNDFVELVLRLGAPPQLLWVTCGNVTNARLKAVFAKIFPQAQALLAEGRPVIEIADEN